MSGPDPSAVPPPPALWPFALGEALLAALALGGSLLLAPPLAGPARAGLAAAAVGAAVALAALRVGLPHGTNGALAGFSLGFLARLACVAVGLVLSGAHGTAALAWAAAFFFLYAATQGVEIAYVFAGARRSPPAARRSTP